MDERAASICTAMDGELIAASATVAKHVEPSPDAPQVWVSSDLRCIVPQPWDFVENINEFDKIDGKRCSWARDFTQPDDTGRKRVYRRLDMEWYAWLHQRMAAAKMAHQRGTLAPEHWEALRQRFAGVWRYAVARHGSAAIRQATARPVPVTYAEPRLEASA